MRILKLLALIIMLSGCQNNSAQATFVQLQQQVTSCIEQGSNSQACQQKEKRYQGIVKLAMALKESPQGFGHQIIELQSKIIALEHELKQNTKGNSTLSKELALYKQQLKGYIEVIALFESPQ